MFLSFVEKALVLIIWGLVGVGVVNLFYTIWRELYK